MEARNYTFRYISHDSDSDMTPIFSSVIQDLDLTFEMFIVGDLNARTGYCVDSVIAGRYGEEVFIDSGQ